MKAIDLKKLGKNEISFYLAIEKYLLDKNECEDYFFLWDIGPSIIIGKNQVLQNEVNKEVLKELGAKVYRRPSGGGGIYADSGCFMYSFITKEGEKEKIVKEKLSLIIDSLKDLGLDVSFSGRNDLIFKDKKFSGTAIYYKNNKVSLHGTFLYDTNLDDLEKVLFSNKDKLETKGIKSIRSRVINLGEYLPLSREELMDYLLKRVSGNNFIELSREEIKEIYKIKEEFDSKDYILGYNPKYSIKKSHYFKFGYLEIMIDVKGEKIIDFKIMGDFFFIKDIKEYSDSFIGLSFDYNSVERHINELDISKYIVDCENSDIIKLIYD